MLILWHRVGVLVSVILTLGLATTTLLAQDDEAVDDTAITVIGSGIVAPLFEALADASGADAALAVNITGTNSGFEQFCAGGADVITANRPISVDEEAGCTSNGVGFIELLAGHDAIAVITHPETDFVQCLEPTDLNTLFAPSSQEQIVNWMEVNPNYDDLALVLNLPSQTTTGFVLLDNLVEGVGLREDTTVSDGDADIIAAVSETPGALGVVSLSSLSDVAEVAVLELNTAENTGCALPSAETIENRLYPAAERLFIYANSDQLDKPGLQAVLDFLASEDSADAVIAAGFTATTAEAVAANEQVLTDLAAGRQFSREVTDFAIPADLTGAANIAGAAHAFGYFEQVTGGFASQYPGVNLAVDVLGEPDGFRRLCNGAVDIAIAQQSFPDENRENCAANNLDVYEFEFGRQAVVLVAQGSDAYLECLTTDQLATIWQTDSAETITAWDQVGDNLPAVDMTLFAPQPGDPYADLLMISTSDLALPVRDDIELDSDPLYRAAATANVPGALAFMSWAQYQAVLDNEQANIQLVSVDGGDGCVSPSVETIDDGSYPLTRPLNLVIASDALLRPEVQSLLWTMASDSNYAALEGAGFVGIEFAELPDVRAQLQTLFVEAEEQMLEDLEASAQATPDATVEAAPAAEATAEATEPSE